MAFSLVSTRSFLQMSACLMSLSPAILQMSQNINGSFGGNTCSETASRCEAALAQNGPTHGAIRIVLDGYEMQLRDAQICRLEGQRSDSLCLFPGLVPRHPGSFRRLLSRRYHFPRARRGITCRSISTSPAATARWLLRWRWFSCLFPSSPEPIIVTARIEAQHRSTNRPQCRAQGT